MILQNEDDDQNDHEEDQDNDAKDPQKTMECLLTIALHHFRQKTDLNRGAGRGEILFLAIETPRNQFHTTLVGQRWIVVHVSVERFPIAWFFAVTQNELFG